MSQNRKTRRARDISFGRLMQTLRRWDEVQANRIICADIARDFVAGYVLSRLIYWFGDGKDGSPRAKVERDGHLWVARTYHEWFLECRLTEDEVLAAYIALEKLGLIEKRVMKFNGDPTVHLRIVEDVFLEAWNIALDNTAPPDPVQWKAYKKEQAALRKAEKEARRAARAGAEDGESQDLVSRKFRKTKNGNSAIRNPEIPQLEILKNRKSLTLDTSSDTSLVTTPDSKKGVDFSNQHQQHAASGPDVVDVEIPKKIKPVKPAPTIPKIQSMELPSEETAPNTPLPGLAATQTPPPTETTIAASILARLLDLPADSELAPATADAERQTGLDWPQIAAQLLETMPEAQMTPDELIKRLSQGHRAAGLQTKINGPRHVNEVAKNAANVAWHLAIWKSREENAVGDLHPTANFLRRLEFDELLSLADLERLVAPVIAARAEIVAAERDAQSQQQREKDAARAAQGEVEQEKRALAQIERTLSLMEPGKRQNYQDGMKGQNWQFNVDYLQRSAPAEWDEARKMARKAA